MVTWKTQKHQEETHANHGTKSTAPPTLTSDFLSHEDILVENVCRFMERVRYEGLITKADIRKRSGTSVDTLLYYLMMWIWLRFSSIRMFSITALINFSLSAVAPSITSKVQVGIHWLPHRPGRHLLPRRSWRSWCQTHHRTQRGLWLCLFSCISHNDYLQDCSLIKS